MSKFSIHQRKLIVELFDHMDVFENAGNWSESVDCCDVCMAYSDGLMCKTPIARVCELCTETAYRDFAEQQEIAAWHSSIFLQALSPDGELRRRLTVLHRYMESVRIVEKQNRLDLDAMHRLLAANLGWQTDHPLDNTVRQWAVGSCVQVGSAILPILLEHRTEQEPWQLSANIAMCALSIAPADIRAHELIEAAARHPNALAREKIAQLINHPAIPLTPATRRKLQKNVGPMAQGSLFPADQPPANAAPAAPSPLALAIEDSYTMGQLQAVYQTYLYRLFRESDFQAKGTSAAKKLKKRQLAWALAQAFSRKDLFEQLLPLLPPGVLAVLTRLTWIKGEHADNSFSDALKPPVFIRREEKRYGRPMVVMELNPCYAIIPVRKTSDPYSSLESSSVCNLFLPDCIRDILKQYLPVPDEYCLSGLETIEKTDFIYNAGGRILGQISLLCAYIEQGNPKFAKNGSRMLKASARGMAAYCRIVEFYPGKPKGMEYLCTQLMVDFLRSQAIPGASCDPEFLRQMFHSFFASIAPDDGFCLYRWLSHLRGTHALQGYYAQEAARDEKTFRTSMFNVLKELSPDLWYPVDRLIDYCRCRELDLDIVDRSYARNYLTIHADNEDRRSYYSYNLIRVSSRLYPEVVILPAVKSFMFLMAAFGVLEIAYDEPSNPKFRISGADYLTEFDGLRHVRLTPLGAYILGLTDDFVYCGETEAGKLVLDEKRLLIHLDGKDGIKSMALEQIADKISENCYKVTWDSFLKSCETQKDIDGKIQLFRKQVSENPPRIWEDFLNDVVNRVDPLIPQPNLSVFRLKEHPELIELMAQDEVLKKYILKAENYHVLIHAKNLSAVKKRLKTLGYFIHQFR